MQELRDYRIIFDELDRARKEEPYITVELGEAKTKEWDSINELREIVSEFADASEPIFTTT